VRATAVAAVEQTTGKKRFGVIPNEVRNPSYGRPHEVERFLVAALIGMTALCFLLQALKPCPDKATED